MVRSGLSILVLTFVLHTIGLAWWSDEATFELTTGTHFYVGFIHPDRAEGEPLPDSCYRVVIHARQTCMVTVDSRTLRAEAGQPLIVKLPVKDVVEVTSTRPISVFSHQDLDGNGEQSWHLPSSSWGRSYRPFAWWTDRHGLDSSTMRYSSAKRLIIARDNETRVSVETLTGRRDTVLNAGEFWLVSEEVDTTSLRQYVSDPTGLAVKADKPVGVVSGHAKAAVPAYPDGLPMTGPYARSANRCRGNLHEAMLPETMAGTEFVTVPLLYTPTRLRGLDLRNQGIKNDRGDVLRMIALEDSTKIMRILSDGTVVTDTILDRGRVFTHDHLEAPTVWRTSRPVLAAQYGKSYGRITSQASLPEDDPTTDAGMPLMMNIPPVERWITQTSIQTHAGMFNVLSIAARTADLPRIRLNGRMITSMTRPTSIGGTEFSTVTLFVPEGIYTVATDSGRRFACWTYGSLDGFQLGRIYGSAAAVDVRSVCLDSVSLTARTDSTEAQIRVSASLSWQSDTCSELAMLYVSNGLTDSLWYREGSDLVIRTSTLQKPLQCSVVAVSSSGRSDTLLVTTGNVDVPDRVHDCSRPVVLPNPIMDDAVIANLEAFVGSRLEIYSAAGQLMCTQPVSADTHRLPMMAFTSGLYVVRVGGWALTLIKL